MGTGFVDISSVNAMGGTESLDHIYLKEGGLRTEFVF
jgi:hypothetical protein